jgi:Asp-tRNA(Asn)/Glu-tRNA(Gln) amidotransferase A subunit family amidase
MTDDLCRLGLSELTPLLTRREVSPLEVVEAFLARIAAHDPELNTYITVDEAGARAQARDAEARLARGETGPLLGAPLALKDILATKGVRTTCGSRILENYLPPSTPRCAPVCARPARSFWARRTWTSSPWAPPPRIRPLPPPETPGA